MPPSEPSSNSVSLRPGQMWQGTYAPKYHILALYPGFAWVLVHYTGLPAERQPPEPESFKAEFFSQRGMRCIYEPPSDSRLADVLRKHYLAQIVCDHDRSEDNPVCSCSKEHLGWHPSIGKAVDAWVAHVLEAAR